jgi:hypothetical protein
MALDPKLTKSAGEHLVCGELARRGWAASLTRDGLERTDVIALHTSSREMLEVQVKAAGTKASWWTGRKGLVPAAKDREWYVFVHLGNPDDPPRYWVLPRDHVAAATWLHHQAWLHDPEARPGTRHAPVEMARIDSSVFSAYESRWDLLEKSTSIVPVMLARRLYEALPSEGLPPDHPWNTTPPVWTPGD